jgi:hypothetical protein
MRRDAQARHVIRPHARDDIAALEVCPLPPPHKEPVMNVLEAYLLLQVALLIGQTTTGPRVLLDAAEPIAPVHHGVVVNGMSEVADFPSKVWVQEPLRDIVARMWSTSPTFRRQCLQVQAAGAVQVQLRVDPLLLSDRNHLATCELRSYHQGALIARVAVAPIRVAELIGHEMEHVCERLEGIRIDQEATKGRIGYYAFGTSQRHYESDRAIRVGRQVQAEVDITGTLTRTQ